MSTAAANRLCDLRGLLFFFGLDHVVGVVETPWSEQTQNEKHQNDHQKMCAQ